MSGVELLLESAADYERTHQIVLYTLFEKSTFSELLTGICRTQKTGWEPEHQLFDLEIGGDAARMLLELKMWSSLSEQQLSRQE